MWDTIGGDVIFQNFQKRQVVLIFPHKNRGVGKIVVDALKMQGITYFHINPF